MLIFQSNSTTKPNVNIGLIKLGLGSHYKTSWASDFVFEIRHRKCVSVKIFKKIGYVGFYCETSWPSHSIIKITNTSICCYWKYTQPVRNHLKYDFLSNYYKKKLFYQTQRSSFNTIRFKHQVCNYIKYPE